MRSNIALKTFFLTVCVLCCTAVRAEDLDAPALIKSLTLAGPVKANEIDHQLCGVVLSAAGDVAASYENRLICIIEDPEASVDGRVVACRYLRVVGSSKAVPGLIKLLGDRRLAHCARYALVGIPGEGIGGQLLAALSRSRKNTVQIGIINTLGMLKCENAVPTLMTASASTNDGLACAAFEALGKFDSDEVHSFLKKQVQYGRRRVVAAEAWLACAWLRLGQGKRDGLMKEYKWVVTSRFPRYIRVAAMNGLVRSDPKGAGDTMFALLKDPEPDIRRAAARALRSVPDLTAEILAPRMKELRPDVLCIVLPMLGDGGGAATVNTIKKAMSHENEGVRIHAIEALGRLESADAVQSLLPALSSPGRMGKAAYGSLCRIGGPDVGIAIRNAAGSASPSIRGRLIDILRERGDKRALPMIMTAVRDPNPGLSRSACRALASLADEEQLKPMVDMLLSARRNTTKCELAQALKAVVERVKNRDLCAKVVIEGLGRSRARSGAPLISVLGNVGNAKALDAARKYLSSYDRTCRCQAIKTLVDWPNNRPMEDLLGVARNDRELKFQILAVRGYARMVERSKKSASEKLKMLRLVLPLARRETEKKPIRELIVRYEKENRGKK